MNKAVTVLSVVSLIFFIQFISADISVANFSISGQYAPSATIIGWVNLSLSNIPSGAYISSNLGQNISLVSFLKQQAANYSCSTSNCNYSYSVIPSSESIYENFNLSAGQSQVFGFLISGSSGVPSI